MTETSAAAGPPVTSRGEILTALVGALFVGWFVINVVADALT